MTIIKNYNKFQFSEDKIKEIIEKGFNKRNLKTDESIQFETFISVINTFYRYIMINNYYRI